MTSFLPFAFAASFLTAPAPPPKDDVDYQKKADAADWDWHADRASLDYAVKQCPLTTEVRRNDLGAATIRVPLDDKTDFTWEGHAGTVFVVRNKVLYYADFSPYSDGCSVVAVDLEKGKKLWTTPLKGLGGIPHTKYHNAVTMDLDGDALRVLGNESSGKYVEYVDPKTGKTVGHKIFKDK